MKMRKIFFLISAIVHIIALYWIAHLEIPILSINKGEKIINVIPISIPNIISSTSNSNPPTNQISRKQKKIAPIDQSNSTFSKPVFSKDMSPQIELFEVPEITVSTEKIKEIPELSIYSQNIKNVLNAYQHKQLLNKKQQGVGEKVEGLVNSNRPEQNNRILDNIKGYNLKPWAKQALLRIKRNWSIPLTTKEKVQQPVEILTLVEKSGRISQLTIKISSQSEIFDQAAINALRLSSPLPSLPLDFPAQKLETRFLFTSSYQL